MWKRELALKCDETEAGRSENTLQSIKNYKSLANVKKNISLHKQFLHTFRGQHHRRSTITQVVTQENFQIWKDYWKEKQLKRPFYQALLLSSHNYPSYAPPLATRLNNHGFTYQIWIF